MTDILGKRLFQTDALAKVNVGRYTDLSEQLVKITECYEQTRARVRESEQRIKEVTDMVKIADHAMEDRTREIEVISDKLKSTMEQIVVNETTTGDLRQQISSCWSGLDRIGRSMGSLQVDVQSSQESVAQVKQGLKEQSLLLPNISP